MAELGKKLGKLSLAILENFVEKTLGKKFVDELRQPTDRELAIESTLEKMEFFNIIKSPRAEHGRNKLKEWGVGK